VNCYSVLFFSVLCVPCIVLYTIVFARLIIVLFLALSFACISFVVSRSLTTWLTLLCFSSLLLGYMHFDSELSYDY
jgi:hypothetical protein